MITTTWNLERMSTHSPSCASYLPHHAADKSIAQISSYFSTTWHATPAHRTSTRFSHTRGRGTAAQRWVWHCWGNGDEWMMWESRERKQIDVKGNYSSSLGKSSSSPSSSSSSSSGSSSCKCKQFMWETWNVSLKKTKTKQIQWKNKQHS